MLRAVVLAVSDSLGTVNANSVSLPATVESGWTWTWACAAAAGPITRASVARALAVSVPRGPGREDDLKMGMTEDMEVRPSKRGSAAGPRSRQRGRSEGSLPARDVPA